MKHVYPFIMLLLLASCNDAGPESPLQSDNRKLRLQVDSLVNENDRLKKGLHVRSTEDNVTSRVSSQCSGITKKGKRCSRFVKSGNYCWQHKKNS